jgi:hypothetical protein
LAVDRSGWSCLVDAAVVVENRDAKNPEIYIPIPTTTEICDCKYGSTRKYQPVKELES